MEPLKKKALVFCLSTVAFMTREDLCGRAHTYIPDRRERRGSEAEMKLKLDLAPRVLLETGHRKLQCRFAVDNCL